jgi:ribosomal-protein-alanine N-acetyltransferase
MIQTERLFLRQFKTDDAEAAAYNSQRPVVAHFMSDMILSDEESARNWIDWINGRFNTEEPFIVFAIELLETNNCIGLIGLAPKGELDNEL